MKRVTGIGGIFFKSKDPEQLRQWYRAHLGIESQPHRVMGTGPARKEIPTRGTRILRVIPREEIPLPLHY